MSSSRQFFPILKLPDVAIQTVVSQIDVNTIINLHLNSTKIGVRHLISKCARKPWRVNVLVAPTFQSVEVVGASRFAWECYLPRHPDAANYRSAPIREVELNGYTVKVSEHPNRMVTISERFENDLINWTQFLKTLFQCKIHTISLHPRHTISFHAVFASPVLFNSEHLILGDFALRTYEADYFIQHYETTYFECRGTTPIGYRCTQPIKFPIVEFSWGNNLTLDNLVQMSNDCVNFKISRARFTSEQVNEWLKGWMGSESRKLKTFELAFTNDNALDKEKVLEGVEKVAAEVCNFNLGWLESAWTVQRLDGLQATIFFFSTGKTNNVQFNVMEFS